MEMLRKFEREYKPVGTPVTGKVLLSGDLNPTASIAEATSEESYQRWLAHYNKPPVPAELSSCPPYV